MALKRIDTNPIVEMVARKNKKFRKYLELKKKGKIIRTQPKLPGMKKGKSVKVKCKLKNKKIYANSFSVL